MNAAIAILALAICARADTVELKTGEKIEGRFKQATDAGVVIEVGGQPITFGMDKVRAIYLGAAPAAQQEPPAYGDALDALKALQSITTSGVSYRDYAPRVLDAKVKVDKYLALSTSGDDAPRIAMRLAMQYYELASNAWGATFSKDVSRYYEVGVSLRGEPALVECPSVKVVIAETDARNSRNPPAGVMLTGLRVGEQPAILWVCAASKIAEAEKQ